MVKGVEHPSCFGRSGDFRPYWSQTDDIEIDTYHFLARRSALLHLDKKDWLAQCQDNVIESDIRSWCWWPGLPVGQSYKVPTSVHCHKSATILI